MRDELINFLEKLNIEQNGELLSVDIAKYVDKIQKFATIISIFKKGEIVAFIAFYENDKNSEVAYLTMIAVCNNFWHLGYGKTLLEISIKEIKKKGFKLYRLEVKGNNLKAIKFYEKYGFMSTESKNGLVKMEKLL